MITTQLRTVPQFARMAERRKPMGLKNVHVLQQLKSHWLQEQEKTLTMVMAMAPMAH